MTKLTKTDLKIISKYIDNKISKLSKQVRASDEDFEDDFEEISEEALEEMVDFLESKGWEVTDSEESYQFEWNGECAGGFVKHYEPFLYPQLFFEIWTDGDRGETPRKHFTSLKDLKGFLSKNRSLLNKMKEHSEAERLEDDILFALRDLL